MATIDTYLSGNYAPISEEITATALPVTGTIPAELDGRLIRNGPNPVDGGHPDAHWFTGTGMVHGVRLRDGKADWYRNRFVVSDRVSEALGRPITPGTLFPYTTLFRSDSEERRVGKECKIGRAHV